MRVLLVWLALAAGAGCGPRVRIISDAGVDAGEDGGVDAGRDAGVDPPAGYSVAVEQPAATSARLGTSLAMSLDQNDQPMLAYYHEDPNGDGVQLDTRLVFTRWDGVSNKWEEPRTVEVVGSALSMYPYHRQISLARDSSTGRLGIAYLKTEIAVRLAVSDDEGINWSLETASANAGGQSLSSPELAMAGGKALVAYRSCGAPCALIFRTRGATGSYSEEEAPLLAGTTNAGVPTPIALEVDAAGKPGLAYFLEGAAPDPVVLAFWRPGAAPTKVADSEGKSDLYPSVSLTFAGALPRLAFHLKSADPAVLLRYGAATDPGGTSWAAPVAIPRNGSVGALDGTKWHQAVAVSGNKLAIAAYYGIATAPPQLCGGPKLALSQDGTSFTVCSPDKGLEFGQAGLWINAAYSRAGKLTLAFLYDSQANPSHPAGVTLWLEP